MRTFNFNKSRAAAFLGAAGIFAAVLAFLFRASFRPSFVMFANDASLGLLAAQYDIVWTNYLAYWPDLNWLGANLPPGGPGFTPLSYALLGPVLFAKFQALLSLLLLAMAAWFFCRQARFNLWVCALAGLAAGLNSNVVSYACWGLPPKALSLAAILVALGLLQDGPEGWRRWLRVVLAGFFVGIGVVEGADVGAILSLYVAIFAMWQAFAESSAKPGAILRKAMSLMLIALCAGWIAAHSLSALVSTQITGVTGMKQNSESHEQRWEFATFGSLPLEETWRLAVPGLFGYRMDTPGGGAYWGGVGSDGTPQGRFSGSGEYVGVLVLLVGAFGVANSLRREKSPFTPMERKLVWFWTMIACGSLLLAYGKFAPFYRLFFELPYFSTIRFPMKFLHGLNLSCWILFAYGLEALARSHLGSNRVEPTSPGRQFKAWRQAAPTAERRWVLASLWLLGAAVFAAIVYASRGVQLDRYLATISFPSSEPATAAFSIREAWLALMFLALAVGAVGLAVIGCFAGRRGRLGWVVLATILILDLVRANTPWVRHYDYKMRYQSNAMLDLLKDHPWEHRVTGFVVPRLGGGQLVYAPQELPYFPYVYKEWLEHQFQYYHIQSLDIDQMPRTPELDAAYLAAFAPANFGLASQLAVLVPQLDRVQADQAAQIRAAIPAGQSNLFYVTRLWELTNTRYQLGMGVGIDAFNDLFDPVKKRFRVVLPYALALKPGAPQPATNASVEDVIQLLTAVPTEKGPLAVIEFTGALPRARLYTQWELIPDDPMALGRLRSPAFDPAKSIVLSGDPGIKPAPELPPGEVSFVSYSPKRIILRAKSTAAAVLLLNDRWHPDWHVTVDGQPASLLRANYIMRGVAVPAGEHTVEFRFAPPNGMLWVSLSAVATGIICAGFLVFSRRGMP